MYKTYYPKNELLKKYIKSFWTLTSDKNPICTVIQPTPSFDLIFSFKNSTRWKNSNSELHLKNSYISGIRDKTYIIQPQGQIDYFAIEFSVNGLYHFIRNGISDLINHPIEIYDLKSFKELEEKLYDKHTTAERLLVVESELIKLFYHNNIISHDDRIIQYVIDYIIRMKGVCKINQICNSNNIYHKKLERLFKRYTGINPKQFVKLIRFDNTFNSILNNSFSDWTDIVYENGFYDQSHFIKEFNLFTDMSPSYFYQEFLPYYI
jgi:AraC-like DNA-binding protein